MKIPKTYEEYTQLYDIWPDLARYRVIIMPVRAGMNRRTGKILIGWDHVVQSIQTIFQTRYHERVLRRWVGSFVPHILGESAVPPVITRFFWAIASCIELWEPNYRVSRVRVETRASARRPGEGTSPETHMLTSAEELRTGRLTSSLEGVYRPRAHLDDPTPEARRQIGWLQRGQNMWEPI